MDDGPMNLSKVAAIAACVLDMIMTLSPLIVNNANAPQAPNLRVLGPGIGRHEVTKSGILKLCAFSFLLCPPAGHLPQHGARGAEAV